jgi:chemotaxis protein MotC
VTRAEPPLPIVADPGGRRTAATFAPRRRAITVVVAAATAAGALLAASGAVRSADWAERFTRAPSPSSTGDDRAGSRLEAAASALMAQSLAPFRRDPDSGEAETPAPARLGAAIMPPRLVDRDRRGADRSQKAALPVAPPQPPAEPVAKSAASAATPRAETRQPQASRAAKAAPVRRDTAVPLPPRRPTPAATGPAESSPHRPAEPGLLPTAPLPAAAGALPATLPARAEPGGTAAAAALTLLADATEPVPGSDGAPAPATASTLAADVDASAVSPEVAPAAPDLATATDGKPPAAVHAPSTAARAILPAVVGIGQAFAEEPPPPPLPIPSQSEIVRLARALSALQDDMARGSGAALNAQGVLMRTIAEVYTSSDPGVWSEPHNARSLALYGLSGGNPQVIRAVVAKGTLNASFEPLVAGALAYLEGRAEDARRHFAAIDPTMLDPSVVGPFFLAHAALRVESDVAAARRDLDAARLAAPGSLVEEAALRRAILIAAESDDVDSFDRLVNRYLRRFRESVYAGNFRRRLAAAVTRMSFIREPGAFDRLDRVLAPMTAAGRQELYLLVSRAAVENGSRRAAALAAERAADTAPEGTLDATRARLYRAAALVVDPAETDAALETLRSLAAEALPADDAALLSAALELATAVTQLPAGGGDEEVPTADVSPAAEPGAAPETEGAPAGDVADAPAADLPEDDIVAAVETRAATLLDAVDLLLADSGDQP